MSDDLLNFLNANAGDDKWQTSINPACPNSERDTLVAFYNATDGDNWNRSDNWLNNNVSICEWYGVQCGGSMNKDTLETSKL